MSWPVSNGSFLARVHFAPHCLRQCDIATDGDEGGKALFGVLECQYSRSHASASAKLLARLPRIRGWRSALRSSRVILCILPSRQVMDCGRSVGGRRWARVRGERSARCAAVRGGLHSNCAKFLAWAVDRR